MNPFGGSSSYRPKPHPTLKRKFEPPSTETASRKKANESYSDNDTVEVDSSSSTPRVGRLFGPSYSVGAVRDKELEDLEKEKRDLGTQLRAARWEEARLKKMTKLKEENKAIRGELDKLMHSNEALRRRLQDETLGDTIIFVSE
ncbi:hypothetical protein BT96DRAFT_970929 [Gymnopus androsaceus JB14]|uniref:BZIP domain-containing protein n=1 Tax=Gymnopus androsaceus JB14 TaxID=1447944 RepID=A0A6A4ICG6_9AGAR|nr:hypothetical protein BT96DRAFT_970929 [Gymnopus androsaceus JB14]